MAITNRLISLNAIIATALAGCAVSDDSVGRYLVKPETEGESGNGFGRGAGQQRCLRVGICATARYDE